MAWWSRAATTAGLIAGAACSGQAVQPKRPPVPVSVVPVRQVAVPYTIVANGTVIPLQTAVVSPQTDGIISRVNFREGQDVTAGQVLFELDPAPYQAAYDQALSALARDSATAENSAREAARYTELEHDGSVTHEQAESVRATNAVAAATVLVDRAALAAARISLHRTTIRAPIGGRTGALLVREGNLVHAAATPALVVINEMEPILVRFAFPGTALPLLLQYGRDGGLPVTVLGGGATPAMSDSAGPPVGDQAGAVATDPSPPAAAGTGALSFIDNAVDTTTGTIMLKATFPNTSRTLWPGEFVTASLLLYTEQNALVVPTSAVLTGQQGTYVYVVDSTETAQERAIVVERAAANLTVIAAGVRLGEQVVVSGQSRLTPGATVSLATGFDSAPALGHAARPHP
jgi:multidrug efflux system membrane fusion protein